MTLITISNWPASLNDPERRPNLNDTWQFVVREDMRRHVLDARLPGIIRKEMVHVVFGPSQTEPGADKTVVATVEISPHESPNDPLKAAARLASFLGNAMKDRLDEGWRAEIFIHLHHNGTVYSGFWAG
ncbi:hypothetical protein KJ611_00150 [Patescibacteria group bacterium]|nr:hypothetical protein [Patescibacteria group bacterium]MBU1705652.1 hypothetical protein [Patescibacteria group bacterium]